MSGGRSTDPSPATVGKDSFRHHGQANRWERIRSSLSENLCNDGEFRCTDGMRPSPPSSLELAVLNRSSSGNGVDEHLLQDEPLSHHMPGWDSMST